VVTQGEAMAKPTLSLSLVLFNASLRSGTGGRVKRCYVR